MIPATLGIDSTLSVIHGHFCSDASPKPIDWFCFWRKLVLQESPQAIAQQQQLQILAVGKVQAQRLDGIVFQLG